MNFTVSCATRGLTIYHLPLLELFLNYNSPSLIEQRYTPNGLEVNFFQKRRQESEERLCVRSLAQQSRSGKIGYEKTDIKQT
jgi:hypothetical protein